MKEKTKEEIDAACTNADYHLQEIVDGLIPDVEELDGPLREDIRRRLISSFYDGMEYARSALDEVSK